MKNILNCIAILMCLLWAIGYFGYAIGPLIHILLVAAIISLLLRIISGSAFK
jgi:hypothetical protein